MEQPQVFKIDEKQHKLDQLNNYLLSLANSLDRISNKALEENRELTEAEETEAHKLQDLIDRVLSEMNDV